MVNNLVHLYRQFGVTCRSIMAGLQEAKKLAAYKAVDDHVQDNLIVGVGSGSTAVLAVERMMERVRNEHLNIKCIPTSFQARQLIIQSQLPLTNLEINPEIDVTIDGADEVDENLTCIKGGGACFLQEKIVAYNSKKLVIIADYTKDSVKLGQQWKKGIPLEVDPMAYYTVKTKIEKTMGGEAELRIGKMKAGPVITDGGNFILDWKDFNPESNWEEVNMELLKIPGLFETGLFVDMAVVAYFGMSDGTVKVRTPKNAKDSCDC
ncbi:unnamed protein product [Phyllotreta striolata]|uniref:ribose-5-phosphate isomerase n=1 Tax=Phyllotreta striolata TaxID=444603 RepID=A0A9N9TKQ6_PHYSR|nr:unnamed protein product [Phyllotreta striolata]